MKLIKSLTILMLLSVVAPFAALADSFKVNVASPYLELGETVTLQFVLDNQADYYGFQADVHLPTGLEAVLGDNEQYITLSSRAAAAAKFQVNSNIKKDGTLVMGAFSAEHKPFTGNSGVLAEMKVKVLDTFRKGNVVVEHIYFINENNQDVKLENTSTTLGVAVKEITLSANTAELKVDDFVTLTGTVTPDFALDKTLKWSSSNPAVASVDATTGKITAKSIGDAIITATCRCGGVTATCEVKVIPTLVTGLEVQDENLKPLESGVTIPINTGNSYDLTAKVIPGNATNRTVTWTSSDETVATVDANGLIDTHKAGNAIITASIAGFSFKANVVVTDAAVPVTGVSIDKNTAVMNTGATLLLTATITPTDATTQEVTWTSSNKDIATVAKGLVTALKAGTVTITATANKIKAECVITINDIEVTGIELNKTEVKLTEEETVTLTATVTPGDATNKTVTWTSSNEDIATVSDEGVVTAVAPGTATITAKAGDKTVTCTVTVEAAFVAVETITLDRATGTITQGKTLQLKATVKPTEATNRTVTWTSSDTSVATVDATGKVTAVKAGTATITAKAGEKTATCVITVEAAVIAVTGVTLDKTEASLTEGETATLTATVAPANATDKTVTWSSSDEKIATVKDGVVTAVAPGTATITATASGKTATCTVTVKAAEVEKPEIPEIPEYTDAVSLYSTDANTWTEADLTEWVNNNSQYVTQTIDGGLKMTGTNSGWESTKEITFTENSIVVLTATLTSSGASGRNGSYDFLRLGNAEVRLYEQDKKASIVIGESETILSGYTRNGDYNIAMSVNQATKEIIVTVSGGATGGATGKLVGELPNDVVVGHFKAGKENYAINETLKAISVKEVVQTVETYGYTIKYTYDGEIIKTEEGSTVADAEVTADSVLTVDGQKYYVADGATTTLTVKADGENVLNVALRKAFVFNYSVKNNVNDATVTGTCVEGNNASVPYSRYILKNGTVWMKDATDKEYNYSFTPNADNYAATLEYASTETTDAIFFSEAENIDGMTEATGASANVRCSNAAGGYAAEAVALYTLKPGKYKVKLGIWGNAGATFVVKAGEETIMTAETKGYWYEETSSEFTLKAETTLTFEGAESSKPLDYVLITGKADATSGIYTVEGALDGKWYNLQGVQIDQPTRPGIYIHNGKKVVVK